MLPIEWSEDAINDYHQNIEFILSRWTESVAKKFIDEVETILSLIQEHPQLYPFVGHKNIRKAVIRKQVSLFYLVQEDRITLVRFWNNFQDTKNLNI
ncbi:Plasmid stabilization system protein ParE [Ekhidna lutea]|uniref:Plasmid stabilization system protein ParE n=1 Tax=Ekhidna lutea TaxID=447679 RepID=A0A239JXP4_EKHLU|nr:type II toxin-antitoxin system RelE/ParE family toxin [Ekhidna lutea]SNT10747.1 Plasmid stabilization system protein ParE [Ekhidna lutea]